MQRRSNRTVSLYKALLVCGIASMYGAANAQINVAQQLNGGVATQSSNWVGSGVGEAHEANDGDRNGLWSNGSVSHTTSELNAWWQVQLDAVYEVNEILVWNRLDGLGHRINPFRVQIFSGASLAWESTNNTFVDDVNDGITQTQGMRFVVPSIAGDRVRIQLEDTNYLHMAEVEVYSPVPEPATMAALGLGSLLVLRRRKRS